MIDLVQRFQKPVDQRHHANRPAVIRLAALASNEKNRAIQRSVFMAFCDGLGHLSGASQAWSTPYLKAKPASSLPAAKPQGAPFLRRRLASLPAETRRHGPSHAPAPGPVFVAALKKQGAAWVGRVFDDGYDGSDGTRLDPEKINRGFAGDGGMKKPARPPLRPLPPQSARSAAVVRTHSGWWRPRHGSRIAGCGP